MRRKSLALLFVLFLALPGGGSGISKFIQQVCPEKVELYLKTLESFDSRFIYHKGNRRAARWLAEKLRSFGLKVELKKYLIKGGRGRIPRDVEIINVVAELKGGDSRVIVAGAHYDSIAFVREGNRRRVDFNGRAPGVNDDGSGTAAVLELARILSKVRPEHTILFVLFSAEEEGLVGSTIFAEELAKQGREVLAVIVADMIGNVKGAEGLLVSDRVRIFAPPTGSSAELGRYFKRVSESYLPHHTVELIYRMDRFGRGGDHIPFALKGFPAVRLVEAVENYAVQHTAEDTFENMSLSYCVENIKSMMAVVASLAFAPPPPVVVDSRGRPMIGRGGSGYDAVLRWKMPCEVEDLAGFRIYMKRTTSPFWERSFFTSSPPFVLRRISIDNYDFAVAAVDREGNESLPARYAPPERRPYRYSFTEVK